MSKRATHEAKSSSSLRRTRRASQVFLSQFPTGEYPHLRNLAVSWTCRPDMRTATSTSWGSTSFSTSSTKSSSSQRRAVAFWDVCAMSAPGVVAPRADGHECNAGDRDGGQDWNGRLGSAGWQGEFEKRDWVA